MDEAPLTGRPRFRDHGLIVGLGAVTVLAVADVLAGSTVALAGVMTVGPCLAAIWGSTRIVGAVGAYCVFMLILVSEPDQIWWTTQQAVMFVAILAVTAVSMAAARSRARIQQALLEAQSERAEAAATNLATRRFLSRVSHEFRTPLNAVRGFTELLEHEPLTPSQRESVAHVSRAGAHMLELVDDVLDLSASRSGGLSLSLESVPVREVLDGALDLVGPQLAAASLELVRPASDAKPAFVRADAVRLRQIFVNLLSNAVKYNRPQGTVTVAVITDAPTVGMVSVSIGDDGHGLTSKDLGKLFSPFERLGAADLGVEGTGLGLTVSHALATAMGGSLTVRSRVGSGSTFTVALPSGVRAMTIEPLAIGQPQPPLRVEALVRPTGRLLYVEDNPANLRLVERLLARRPHWELTSTERGEDGLATARREAFDLVLLDQHLPDLHGLEILRQIRADPSVHQPPMVIVSADAGPEQQRRAVDAGADGYLVKPFTMAEFLAVVDRYQDAAAPRPSSP